MYQLDLCWRTPEGSCYHIYVLPTQRILSRMSRKHFSWVDSSEAQIISIFCVIYTWGRIPTLAQPDSFKPFIGEDNVCDKSLNSAMKWFHFRPICFVVLYDYSVPKKMSFSGKTAITPVKLIQDAKVGGVLENSGYLLQDGHWDFHDWRRNDWEYEA